jgi:hypothetical protein
VGLGGFVGSVGTVDLVEVWLDTNPSVISDCIVDLCARTTGFTQSLFRKCRF